MSESPTPPSSSTDPEIHDHDAWMRRLARSLVSDPDAADDIAQKTWLVALRHPRDRGSRMWLATVMRNIVRTQWRRDRLRRDFELDAEPLRGSLGPEDGALRHELSESLRGALEDLSEPFRSTLQQRFLLGRTSVEIARTNNVPEGTVRWRTKRGLDELRRSLDSRFDGGRPDWIGALALAYPSARRPARAAAVAAAGTIPWIPLAASLLLLVGGAAWVLAWVNRPSQVDALELANVPLDISPPEVAAAAPAPIQESERQPDGAEDPVPLRASAAESAPLAVEAARLVTKETPSLQLNIAVTKADGKTPLPGARLLVLAPHGFVDIGGTDDNGRGTIGFHGRDFHGGGFRRTPGAAGIRIAAKGYSVSTLHSLTRETVAGAKGRELHVVMDPNSCTVEGRLLDGAGQPVVGAEVIVGLGEGLRQMELSPGFNHTMVPCRTATDADGSFSIEGVWASELKVRATKPGLLDFAMLGAAGESGTWTIEGTMTRGLTFCGVAMSADGSPCPGAEVWADPLRRGGLIDYHNEAGYEARLCGFTRPTVAGEDGAFVLTGIDPGKYRIWAKDPRDPEVVSSLVGETRDAEAVSWNPVLVERQPFEVKVVDAEGTPQPGLGLLLTDTSKASPRWRRYLETGEDGTVALVDWAEGPIEVIVSEAGLGTTPLELVRNVNPAVGQLVVRLRPKATTHVKGIVVDSSGAPLTHGSVTCELREQKLGVTCRIAQNEGTFGMSVPSGPAHLRVDIPGHGLRLEPAIALQPGEPHEARIVMPDLVPVRNLRRRSAEPSTTYKLIAHTDYHEDWDAMVVVLQGSGSLPKTLELYPGLFSLIVTREDGKRWGTFIPVIAGQEGRFDSTFESPPVVPLLVRIDGRAPIARSSIELRRIGDEQAEPIIASRASASGSTIWFVQAPAGDYEVRLLDGTEAQARPLSVRLHPIGSMGSLLLDFEG